MYDCTVVGTASTIWRGSAVISQCHNNKGITFRHTQFNESGSYNIDIINCSHGTITATAIGVVQDMFMSQLNVTITRNTNLNNKTVQCEDHNQQNVGSSTIVNIHGKCQLTIYYHDIFK